MRRQAFAALGALMLCGAAGPLDGVRVSRNDYDAASPYRYYPDDELKAWQGDVLVALKRGRLARDAAALGRKFQLSAPVASRLAKVWIASTAVSEEDTARKAEIRTEVRALGPLLHDSSFGVRVLAESLASLEDCPVEEMATLLAGAKDVTSYAYQFARAAPCLGTAAVAASLTPDRASPAIIQMEGWGLPPVGDLAILQWLNTPEALLRVAQADRRGFSIWSLRRYLARLSQNQLAARVAAVYDALAPDLRGDVMSPSVQTPQGAWVDGVRVSLEEGGGSAIGEPAPIWEVAEALTIMGRESEARALLARLPGLVEAKKAVDCAYNWTPGKADCPQQLHLPYDAVVLDHVLNEPQSDPYPLQEAFFGAGVGSLMSASPILCRAFGGEACTEGFGPTVAALTENALRSNEYEAQAEAALARAVPGYVEQSRSFLQDARPAAAEKSYRRKSVTPTSPGFAELSIPQQYLGEAPEAKRPRTIELPIAFTPVRVERSGPRVVAISLSQTFDPTGEVSGGGYWVHVSDDRGRTWGRPLYTGLADRFPYIVLPQSKLPLIDGDMLNVAVEVAEIDTSSITYPPVGLSTRREEKDLYLRIPLAELMRDANGDGLSDIAARRLLLDRPKSAKGTPFLVLPGTGVGCPATASLEQRAIAAVLAQIYNPSDRALIEPVHRSAAPPVTAEWPTWDRTSSDEEGPLFMIGDPTDYTCVDLGRPVLVYSKEDRERLESFSPDFHLLSLPPIVFNRARDRAYAEWSMQWVGGAFRLRLVNGQWVIDTLQSWIS